ncbi:MAG: hypothetical protein IJJ56_14305 [Prevotella sp.]|nr:hypothetical protein [Prevotella sp.]
MRKWLFVIGLAFIVSCSSIDCPVNNVVATRYRFYNTDGDSLILMDTLSVTSVRKDGTDTLILNRNVGKASFQLPISYSHPEDILVFNVYNGTMSVWDTVWVKKDDIPHFESVDCNASFFHKITGIRHTTNFIDSIVINNPTVDYDKTTIHFYIYPKVSD